MTAIIGDDEEGTLKKSSYTYSEHSVTPSPRDLKAVNQSWATTQFSGGIDAPSGLSQIFRDEAAMKSQAEECESTVRNAGEDRRGISYEMYALMMYGAEGSAVIKPLRTR